MYNLKILTISVNGLGRKDKRTNIFHYFKALQFDILCLQETQSSDNSWEKEWKGQSLWHHGTSSSRGIAFLFHSRRHADISDIKTDNEGRILSILVSIDNFTLNLMNIYAPTELIEREHFIKNLQQFISPGNSSIILGDFNCTKNLNLDKTGGNPSRGNRGITELINVTNLFFFS